MSPSENQGEPAAGSGGGLGGEGAAVQVHYAAAQAEAYSAAALFGGEERDEYLFQYIGEDSRAVVGY